MCVCYVHFTFTGRGKCRFTVCVCKTVYSCVVICSLLYRFHVRTQSVSHTLLPITPKCQYCLPPAPTLSALHPGSRRVPPRAGPQTRPRFTCGPGGVSLPGLVHMPRQSPPRLPPPDSVAIRPRCPAPVTSQAAPVLAFHPGDLAAVVWNSPGCLSCPRSDRSLARTRCPAGCRLCP